MRITTTNITLRDWQSHDMPQFLKWNTGWHPWMDFNGPYYPNLTPEKVEETIASYKKKIDNNDWEIPRKRLVIADKKTNEFLGTVSWYWQSQETNWKSIGIVICNDDYWGKGVGFEALKGWISYLFEQDPTLVRLDLRTWSGNIGMMKLGTKLGFQKEACFRKARIVKGEYFDSIGMGLLREEWQELLE